MWKSLGKLLLKAGAWCVGHPGEVIKIVTTAKTVTQK